MNKFVISSVAALALVAGAGSANGQTVAELQALIASLQSQIAALAGTTTTTTVTSSYVNPGVTLRVGSKGVAVTALQNALNNLGFNAGKADGVFGNGTAAAVRAFQASKGLGADGVAGNQTHGALTVALSGTTTTPTTPGTSTNLSGADARLNKITLRSEDNANVGSRKQKVASFEVDLGRQSGDIQLNRVDLEINIQAKTPGSTEDRLFRIFDAITIADASGNSLGEARTTSRNDWLQMETAAGSTTGTISILGFKGVAKGDARTEFQILVDTARLSESDLDIDGEIKITEVRYTEATGAMTSENGAKLTGTATFTIEGEESSDLRVTRSTANPKESTIEGSETTEIKDATVFVFNVESRKVDAEIDTIKVNLSGTAADATHIKRARIYRGTTELASANIVSGAVNFDLRDYALRADRSEEFSVKLDLAKIDGSVTGGKIKVDSVDVTVYDNNDKKVTKTVTNNVEHTFSLPVATKVSGQYQAPVMDGADTVTKGFISIKFEIGEALHGTSITNGSGAVLITTGTAGIFVGTGGDTSAISYELYEDDGQTLVGANHAVSEGEEYVYVVKFGKADSFPNPELEIKTIAGKTVSGIKHSR